VLRVGVEVRDSISCWEISVAVTYTIELDNIQSHNGLILKAGHVEV
jgi:hypothetical protein